MKLTSTLCLIFILPQLVLAQDWKTTEIEFIKNLSGYRNELMQGDQKNIINLGALIERWKKLNPDKEFRDDIVRGIQYTYHILDWDYNDIYKKLNKVYPPNELTQSLTQEDHVIIVQNAELIDLIYEGILKPEYPFKIAVGHPFYKELEFYNFQNGETIGEIGAGTGMFSLMLSLLNLDLDISCNELNPNLIKYMEKKIRTNQASLNLENIQLVKGHKKKCNFSKTSLDKIIIRNTFHHFSHKKQMLESIKASLKPNGVLYLLEYTSDKGAPYNKSYCKDRMTEHSIKSLLKKKGFILKEEISLGAGLLLKYQMR